MNTRFGGRGKGEPTTKKPRKNQKLEYAEQKNEMIVSPAMELYETPRPKPRTSVNQFPMGTKANAINEWRGEDQIIRAISPNLPQSSQTQQVPQEDSDDELCYTDLKNVTFQSSMQLNNHQENYTPRTEDFQADRNVTFTSSTGGFSLANSLTNGEKRIATISEKMSTYWKNGNLLEFGRLIREGMKQKTLSSVQLEELARNLDPPQIPMMQLLLANEHADVEDLKSFNASYIFLHSMPPLHEKPIKRLQCSINAISTGINETLGQQQQLEHRHLDHYHRLIENNPFVSLDLNKFYMSQSLVGGGTVYQLTNVIVQLFKQVAQPKYEIWKYSFHPNSSKAVDSNFLPLPITFIQQIRDFSLDVCGSYLPEELLSGPIDPNDRFIIQHLSDDYDNEIRRRRLSFSDMRKTIDQAIWQALRTVRSYHYNTETTELQSCSGRTNCSKHVKWEDLKSLRFTKKASSPNGGEMYTVQDIIAHSHSIRGQAKVDRRTHSNLKI